MRYERPHFYTESEIGYDSKEIHDIFEEDGKHNLWIPIEHFDQLLSKYNELLMKQNNQALFNLRVFHQGCFEKGVMENIFI